jgi:hypothetical protein
MQALNSDCVSQSIYPTQSNCTNRVLISWRMYMYMEMKVLIVAKFPISAAINRLPRNGAWCDNAKATRVWDESSHIQLLLWVKQSTDDIDTYSALIL